MNENQDNILRNLILTHSRQTMETQFQQENRQETALKTAAERFTNLRRLFVVRQKNTPVCLTGYDKRRLKSCLLRPPPGNRKPGVKKQLYNR